MSYDHDHLMKTEQIFDDFQGKDQAVINCEVYNKLKSLEDSKEEDYVIVDSLPSKPSAGDEDKIYLVPTEEKGVYDSYKWDQRVAGWASQGQIEVPDSAIVLTKEEGDKFYQKKLIPGAGITIDEDGNISVTANTDIFKPVPSLPDAPDEEDKNRIFLVENSSEEEGNFYDEYIWAVNDEHPDGYWEKIGSTKIDLSGYLTEEAADEKYQPIAPPEDPYVKKSELPDLTGYIKVEEVDGKKVVVLPMDTQLMGSIDNAIYALLSLRKYAQEEGADLIQVEVGTTHLHLNLNTLDNITYDTPEGKKTIATLDDLENAYVLNGLWGVEEGSDQSVIEAAIGSWDGLVSAIKNKRFIVDYNQSTNVYHSVIYATVTSEVAVNLIMVEGNTYRIYQVQNVSDTLALGVTERKLAFNTDLDSYVKKEEGKGLSSNDFTDEYKDKLDKVNTDVFIIDLSNSDEAKQVHLALVEKYKDITSSQPVQGVYVKNMNKVGLIGKTNLIPITGVAIKSSSPHFFCDLTVQFQFGELPSQSCFGNLEFYFSEDGTASYQVTNTLINNGGNILNYQDGGLIAKAALKYVSGTRGKVQLVGVDDKVISELDADLYSIPWRVDLPIRTPLNKVFEESEILEWFHVKSVSELKTVVNTRNLYMKYGILLTGKPMYYNMQIHYAAFESNTQVKLVWVGLDTSNDAATKYTLIINLDGTVIENNSNVSLKLESLASSGSQDSYVVVDELTEDYTVPANPEKKEVSYEIHVGSEVHNISAAEGVKWQNNSVPEVKADHIYVVSVINNLAVWGEF